MKLIYRLLYMQMVFFPQLLTAQTDTLLQTIRPDKDSKGVTLIQSGNYESANTYLSNQISSDPSDAKAYFQRGVANWAMSDTLSACRDWSSVLALGDTEMFNLLESRCHSTMIIENDTIPAKNYKKMWRTDPSSDAKLVVDQMPEFPGGPEKMAEYFVTKRTKKNLAKHGLVYVNFLISPKGKILFPYVKHGIGKEYDAEAIRLIRSMPDWKPGKDKGKPVYVRSSIPVRF